MWVRNDEIWFDWIDPGRRIFAMSLPLLPLRRIDNTNIVQCVFNVNTAFGQMAWFSERHSAFSSPAIDRSLPLFSCKIIIWWGIKDYSLGNVIYLFVHYVVAIDSSRLIGNRTVKDLAKETEIKMIQMSIIYRSKKSLFYYTCNFIIYDVFILVFEFN